MVLKFMVVSVVNLHTQLYVCQFMAEGQLAHTVLCVLSLNFTSNHLTNKLELA